MNIYHQDLLLLFIVFNPTNFLDMKKDYQVAKTRGLEGVKNNKFINKFINI